VHRQAKIVESLSNLSLQSSNGKNQLDEIILKDLLTPEIFRKFPQMHVVDQGAPDGFLAVSIENCGTVLLELEVEE